MFRRCFQWICSSSSARKQVIIAFALLLVALFGLRTLCLWRAPEPTYEPTYEGRNLSSLVRGAVLESDYTLEEVLRRAMRSADNDVKSQIKKALADCAVKGLKAGRLSGLWGAYMFVVKHAPASIRRQLPQWRDPAQVQWAALFWVAKTVAPNPFNPEQNRDLALYEPAVPRLCELARNAPLATRRWMAARALTRLQVSPEAVLPIMLSTLASTTDSFTARDIAQWLGKFTPAPEKAVPVLVQAIELKDNATKIECTNALRAYGSRARFAVGALGTLAKTNHWPTASSAAWALKGIDPEAALAAGIKD